MFCYLLTLKTISDGIVIFVVNSRFQLKLLLTQFQNVFMACARAFGTKRFYQTCFKSFCAKSVIKSCITCAFRESWCHEIKSETST